MKQTPYLNKISWIYAAFYNARESQKITPPIGLRQVHSAEVAVVKELPQQEVVADALVTTLPGVPLMVRTADCAPVLLADTHKPVIGAVHAGWKGSFQGILETTVLKMLKLGAQTETMVAAIGPHLQRASFEAGEDMRSLFPVTEHRLFTPQGKGKYLFDLAAYVRWRLQRAGVQQVETVGDDTKTDLQYMSYRRDPVSTIRQLSAIMIRGEKIR